jgi:hypothetical protein
MKKLILIAALVLSGCAFDKAVVKPEAVVVKETTYVVRIPPAKLLTLPDPVPNINVDTAKQSDISAWLIAKENYTKALEDLLKGVAMFFAVEQAKANDQAVTENLQAKQAGAAAQAGEAASAAAKTVTK